MKPKIILFDYGQTLVHETRWDPLSGAQILLSCALKNPQNVTAEALAQLLEAIKQDILQEFGAASRSQQPLEIPAAAIHGYAFQKLGLEYSLSLEELEWRYWDAAAPAEPAEHIELLLDELNRQGIAVGVVSNLMYSGRTLERRLEKYLPGQKFSFLLSTCDCVFRKPHRRVFELALTMADCAPNEVLFCGDNLYCDIWGAYNAGIRPIWYTKYLKHRPDLAPPEESIEIQDWRELI